MTQMANKIVLVTGGANGIGRELVVRFAAEGARVVSLDTDEAGNARTASLVAEAGGKCDPVLGDCSAAVDVERAFSVAGRVDILINNAATVAGDDFLHKLSEEVWDRVVDVCLKSVFLCCRQALREMMTRRSGVIVNISSVNALTGVHFPAYTAAKGGILSLTKLVAYQYAEFGIRVNAICPGTIVTQSTPEHYDKHPEAEAELLTLYPARSFGTPDDIADCALFLCSDQAKFINGTYVVVDGGITAGYRVPSLYKNL